MGGSEPVGARLAIDIHDVTFQRVSSGQQSAVFPRLADIRKARAQLSLIRERRDPVSIAAKLLDLRCSREDFCFHFSGKCLLQNAGQAIEPVAMLLFPPTKKLLEVSWQ